MWHATAQSPKTADSRETRPTRVRAARGCCAPSHHRTSSPSPLPLLKYNFYRNIYLSFTRDEGPEFEWQRNDTARGRMTPESGARHAKRWPPSLCLAVAEAWLSPAMVLGVENGRGRRTQPTASNYKSHGRRSARVAMAIESAAASVALKHEDVAKAACRL